MKNLLGALLKAQQEFPALVKDATNPAFRSRYATLGAVQEAAFPVLHKHGLVVLQSVRTEVTEIGLLVYVGAALYHVESGENIVQELGLSPSKTDPQGIGSAITYGRRYILMTMLGLAADDDDGNGASVAGARVVSSSRGAPAMGSRGARLGSAPLTEAPAAGQHAMNGGHNGASNGTSNGHSANGAARKDGDRPAWSSINDAVGWSVELGAFESESEARSELRQILQSVYPGRESCKPHELPAVLDAWYTEIRRRLAQRA
jgi:hypothetical protein